VQHRVAFERERVAPERRKERVGTVAEIRAAQVVRDLALHLQLGGVALVVNRSEHARQRRDPGRIDRLGHAHAGIIAPARSYAHEQARLIPRHRATMSL
jgi:hypothetical protein